MLFFTNVKVYFREIAIGTLLVVASGSVGGTNQNAFCLSVGGVSRHKHEWPIFRGEQGSMSISGSPWPS